MRKKEPVTPPPPARVLKYAVPIDDQWHAVPTPRKRDYPGYEIGIQDGVVMIWTVAQSGPEIRTDKVKVVGTGHEWNPDNYYLGSVQDPRGFVWHLIAGGNE